MEILIRLVTILLSLFLTLAGFKEAKDKNLAGVVWMASLLALLQFQNVTAL